MEKFKPENWIFKRSDTNSVQPTMTDELEKNPGSIPITSATFRGTAVSVNQNVANSAVEELSKTTCRCCRFAPFVGSTFKLSENFIKCDSNEYKPYFELETEEEKSSYEYFKLLARVTYDEVVEKHREEVLKELHQYRLSLLLEELRLIDETDISCSSLDECFSKFQIRIPEKRRSLLIKNKKKRFRKQTIRK